MTHPEIYEYCEQALRLDPGNARGARSASFANCLRLTLSSFSVDTAAEDERSRRP